MYSIDTELLPLECGPRNALEIYLQRMALFAAILGFAMIPIYGFILYLSYTHPNSTFPVAALWIAFVFLIFASFGLGYFSWMLRGKEDVIRNQVLLNKLANDIVERFEFLGEWIRSIDRNKVLTEEESKEFDILLTAAEAEIEDIAAITKKLSQNLSATEPHVSDLTQRINELNRQINLLKTVLPEKSKVNTHLESSLA